MDSFFCIMIIIMYVLGTHVGREKSTGTERSFEREKNAKRKGSGNEFSTQDGGHSKVRTKSQTTIHSTILYDLYTLLVKTDTLHFSFCKAIKKRKKKT